MLLPGVRDFGATLGCGMQRLRRKEPIDFRQPEVILPTASFSSSFRVVGRASPATFQPNRSSVMQHHDSWPFPHVQTGVENQLEFVTGTVTIGSDESRVGIATCGESKNCRDRCDRIPVTTNTCFQAELAFVTGKNMFAEKGPASSRNTRATGHDRSRDEHAAGEAGHQFRG